MLWRLLIWTFYNGLCNDCNPCHTISIFSLIFRGCVTDQGCSNIIVENFDIWRYTKFSKASPSHEIRANHWLRNCAEQLLYPILYWLFRLAHENMTCKPTLDWILFKTMPARWFNVILELRILNQFSYCIRRDQNWLTRLTAGPSALKPSVFSSDPFIDRELRDRLRSFPKV